MSAIDDLATELARLPGIGRKTALDILEKTGVSATLRIRDLSESDGER